MFHVLPDGKLLRYHVDLTCCSKDEYNRYEQLLDAHSFLVKYCPGKQMLEVYWNYEEPIQDVIGCPSEWVQLRP